MIAIMTREQTWEKLVEVGIVEGRMPTGPWDLSETIFPVADLRGIDLSGTVLCRADFRKANLPKANLSGADFRKANLLGVYLFEADMRDTNLRRANLFQCSLHGADLRRADLRNTNLSNANLTNADLRGADLSKAYLVEANLSGANLTKSNLKGADLSTSTLVEADLTAAVLSGACIDNANLSNWIIGGVVCTHIVQMKSGTQKRVTFAPHEFEKRYTQLERVAELVLTVPLSETAGFIANMIARSVNDVKGATVVSWKAVEALSNSDTRMSFHVWDGDFWTHQKEVFETILEDALNKYLERLRPCDANHSMSAVAATTGQIVQLKDKVDIPGTPLTVDTRALEKKALDYFLRLGKIGDDILAIVRSVFP